MSSYGRSRGNSRYYQFRARPGYASGSYAPANARRWNPRSRKATKFSFRRNNNRYVNVTYSRDTETKYTDWALATIGVDQKITASVTPSPNLNNGIAWASEQWGYYGFDGSGSTAQAAQNNLVRTPGAGSSITSRVGNQITIKKIDGYVTMTAAQALAPNTPDVGSDQWGEQVVLPNDGTVQETTYQYLRTAIRVVIVRDNQVNTGSSYVGWNEVFQESTVADSQSSTFGLHSHPNLSNMGRFTILSDRVINLDANDPQKTIKFALYGSRAGGKVRFTSANSNAQKNKNIWIVWAAQSLGTLGTALDRDIVHPRVVLNGRMAFTDM